LAGSFFSYLSWHGYFAVGAVAVSFVLLVVGLVDLWKGDRMAKVEKTIRYAGVFFLILTLMYFLAFLDWAQGHGYVVRGDKVVLNIPRSQGDEFFYSFMVLTVLWILLFGVSWQMKRRRDQAARQKHAEMFRTLYDEYGPEEAVRIMERAGHDREWLDTIRDLV
jgi:hypothetical protein